MTSTILWHGMPVELHGSFSPAIEIDEAYFVEGKNRVPVSEDLMDSVTEAAQDQLLSKDRDDEPDEA